MEYLAAGVQLIGTLVTILGLVVAAPYSAGQAAGRVWRWLWGAARAAWDKVARLWRRPRVQSVSGRVAAATSTLGALDGVRARIGAADGSHPVAVQLESFRNALHSVHAELDGLWNGQHELRTKLLTEVGRLDAAVAELERQQHEQQEMARQVDARGFPLAAVGALVAGWPDVWLPWWWAFPLLLVGLVAGIVAARWLWVGQGKLAGASSDVAQGWKDCWPAPALPSAPGSGENAPSRDQAVEFEAEVQPEDPAGA